MKCPYCQFGEDRVLDSRIIRDGAAIRRRRECFHCHRRFTTYEVIEERQLVVIKKDGRREPYDREKIRRGLLTACRKRPVATEILEGIVDSIERDLHDRGGLEISAGEIGEQVMTALRELDPVAYVRFASVYRDFQDVGEFRQAISQARRRRQHRTTATRDAEPQSAPSRRK